INSESGPIEKKRSLDAISPLRHLSRSRSTSTNRRVVPEKPLQSIPLTAFPVHYGKAAGAVIWRNEITPAHFANLLMCLFTRRLPNRQEKKCSERVQSGGISSP
ncbi:hypothetical protein TNIN_303511, partial [Trichonephila inaurata madagascariensis]